MSGAPNPAEDLERQIGNQARDLARAIRDHMPDLDVTRTLPGRLVWHPRASMLPPTLLPYPRPLVLDVSTALANGDAR